MIKNNIFDAELLGIALIILAVGGCQYMGLIGKAKADKMKAEAKILEMQALNMERSK